MTKILLCYDKNFQDYVSPVINSFRTFNPDGKIYAVCTSDITRLYDGVEYTVFDPPYRPKPKPGDCRRYPPVIYNYIYAIDLLSNVDRVIVVGVDYVVLSDLSELYSTPVGESGLACVPLMKRSSSYNMRGMIKNWTNKYKVDPEIEDRDAFNTGSMVMDLEILRRNLAVKKMDQYMRLGMVEMAAFCLYADDKWTRVDEKWAARSEFIMSLDGVKMLDYAGNKKPWGDRARFREVWKQYEDKNESP